MSAQTYADKLKDVRWQRKRLEIFNRDGWRCRRCECADGSFHVHHKEYIAGLEPWEYPNELLETLCDACHSKEHPKPPPPEAAPPLKCVRCGAMLHVADVAGRDGKNEPVCEVCALDAEREKFREDGRA